jgi:putative peptidoglycan lipid II flippase
VAANDLASTGQAVTRTTRMLIFVLAPLSWLLIAFAAPTIGLILGRGKFDVNAVELTASALGMYAIGLIALAVLGIVQRAFYALSDSLTPFVVGAATMVLHIALNLMLMQALLHAGIALSASISTIVGVVVLVGLLARRLPNVRVADLGAFLLRCGGLALVSTLVVMLSFSALQLDVTTWLGRIGGVVFAGLGAAIYFGLALAWRVPESQMVLRWGVGLWRREVRA